jgi:hypothetical protein
MNKQHNGGFFFNKNVFKKFPAKNQAKISVENDFLAAFHLFHYHSWLLLFLSVFCRRGWLIFIVLQFIFISIRVSLVIIS